MCHYAAKYMYFPIFEQRPQKQKEIKHTQNPSALAIQLCSIADSSSYSITVTCFSFIICRDLRAFRRHKSSHILRQSNSQPASQPIVYVVHSVHRRRIQQHGALPAQ